MHRYILKELGPRPSNHSLDRIHNDGHYEPGNLRWSTQVEQMKNSRRGDPRGDETRSAVINIRVWPSIKMAAEKRAAEEHRSLTAYLEWLILQDTRRK